jgi:hypothetical protein
MVLLRKNNAPRQVQDYRPISLRHRFSKLIPKTLPTRLASFMQQLVQPNQSTFIKGMAIHDNFHTVQYTTKLMHARKWSCCFLKIDIAKAFDELVVPIGDVASSWFLPPVCELGIDSSFLDKYEKPVEHYSRGISFAMVVV